MISPTKAFKAHLERRYSQTFDDIPIDQDILDLFDQIADYVDIEVYVRLLSFIDMTDFDNFQRFFFVCLRKYCEGNSFDEERALCMDIEMIKGNKEMQIMCLSALQYVFA